MSIPNSRTYLVTELTDSTMTLDINFGNGWWRFKLVSADIDLEYPDFVKITLITLKYVGF